MPAVAAAAADGFDHGSKMANRPGTDAESAVGQVNTALAVTDAVHMLPWLWLLGSCCLQWAQRLQLLPFDDAKAAAAAAAHAARRQRRMVCCWRCLEVLIR
jgi:hypothetical protein